jgi:hypothetical protein
LNPSKVKGTRFESEAVEYLNENGFPTAERRSLNGALDKGDIVNVPEWTLECKNRKALDFAGAVDEAAAEAVNARTPFFAAIVKRPRKNVREAYAVMPLYELVALISLVHEYRKGR